MGLASHNLRSGAIFAPLLLFCVLGSDPAIAADESGNYAIKGAGLQSCEKFLEAHASQTSDLALYGGWIEGFITAQNQRLDNTFDVAPWQTTSTLLSFAKSACEQAKPETRFIDAFAGVFRYIAAGRLESESEVVGLSNGESKAVTYAEIVRRINQKLKSLGLPTGQDESEFTQQTVRSLMSYQAEQGLVQTGLPDQPTLFSLFGRQ